MLLAGATSAQKGKLLLTGADDYAYLNRSGCTTVPEWNDVEEYTVMMDAFKTLEFTPAEVEDVQTVLATILHLGNVSFDAVGDDDCEVSPSSQSSLDNAAATLQVATLDLQNALTSKQVVMGGDRGSMVTVSLKQKEASATRDALAKSLYGRMFDWIVGRVNDTLNKASAASSFHVGVLDIFGFEVFARNSFEQLCINYANEKLQFHFNDFIFNEELRVYKAEGVPYDAITFKDNQRCLDLIEGKPLGLIKLIDEECSMGTGSDKSFAGKIFNQFDSLAGKQPNEYYSRNRTNQSLFTISHFAGGVEYDSVGFLEKNKDTTSDTLLSMARKSGVDLVQTLYKREEQPPSAPEAGSGNPGSRPGRGGSSKKKLSTIGGQFSSQLDGLMVSLRKTVPHFIRCVKSNHDKVPGKFDGNLCLDQLKYAGLFEAIRIRKAGFIYRIPHESFARRFVVCGDNLLPLYNKGRVSNLDVCKKILETATEIGCLKRESWEVGKTKVFLKEADDKSRLEEFRETKVRGMAISIQSIFRMFRAKKAVFKDKYEAALSAAKIRAETAKYGNAALLLQTTARGHLARKKSQDMWLIVILKVAMTKDDDQRIEDAIAAFGGLTKLSALAENVLFQAKATLRQKREKAKFTRDITLALDRDDVPAMMELMERADRLGLSGDPLVLQAREQVLNSKKKRAVHKKLLDFLDDDTKHSDNIQELLDEAKALGVDGSFRTKVEQVYKVVQPKLEIRNKLRRGVEFIDTKLIKQALREVDDMIQQMARAYGGNVKLYQDFCYAEKIAGEKILKMVKLEKALLNSDDNPNNDVSDDDDEKKNGEGEGKGGGEGEGEGCRLKPSYVELCDMIATETSAKKKSVYKQQLLSLAGSRKEFEKVCRSYKWGRIYSTWKFHVPEVGEEVPDDTESFCGLHPLEAFHRSLFSTEEFFNRRPDEVGTSHTNEEDEAMEANVREYPKTLGNSVPGTPSPRKNRNHLDDAAMMTSSGGGMLGGRPATGLQASGRLNAFGEKLDGSPLEKSSGREKKLKGALDMGMGTGGGSGSGHRKLESSYSFKKSEQTGGLSVLEKKMIASRQRVIDTKLNLAHTMERFNLDNGKPAPWH